MLASLYTNGTRVEEESNTAAHLGAHLGVGMVLRLASTTASDDAHPMTVRASDAWHQERPAAAGPG